MKNSGKKIDEKKLSIIAISVSIISLVLTFGFGLFSYFNKDFTTTAYFNLSNLDSENRFAEYDVNIVNSGNRLVILETVNKFTQNGAKRKVDRDSLIDSSVVIQPSQVVPIKVVQKFDGSDGDIKFGVSFRMLDSDGRMHLSSSIFGAFNEENPSKFRMRVSKLNLLTNEAKGTIHYSDSFNYNLIYIR